MIRLGGRASVSTVDGTVHSKCKRMRAESLSLNIVTHQMYNIYMAKFLCTLLRFVLQLGRGSVLGTFFFVLANSCGVHDTV